MIHLFDQIYLSQDVFGVFNLKARQRLYITDFNFPVPLTADVHMQKVCGILGVFTSLADMDEAIGGREKFWENLIADKRDINIVVNNATAVELMVQLWKSIFKTHTDETLYKLYALAMNNDNRLAVSDATNALLPENKGGTDYRIIPLLTREEFKNIYDATPEIEILRTIPKKDLSFELLLIAYLNNKEDEEAREILFKKVERIVRRIYTENFVDMALSLHRRFSSFNRPEYDNLAVGLCPYEMMSLIPGLQWSFSKNIRNRDTDGVLKEFGIRGMVQIYREVREMGVFPSDDKNDRLQLLGEQLECRDYGAVIEADVNETMGSSVFSDTRFKEKINPLTISYFYRLKRLGKTAELGEFALR